MNKFLQKHQQNLVKFAHQHQMKYLALFGSHARGNAKPDSDVDLLVEFNKPVSLLDITKTQRLLSETLDKKVDLLTEDDISPYIKPHILKDLKPVYEQNR